MARLMFPEDGSSFRMQLRRYRFQRGLHVPPAVIAGSPTQPNTMST